MSDVRYGMAIVLYFVGLVVCAVAAVEGSYPAYAIGATASLFGLAVHPVWR